jgi:uncharacterized membrane protein YdbT with pleckstrin-like domain
MLFDREKLPSFLKTTYFFERFDEDFLEEIANHISVLSFKNGTRIYNEQSEADELYLIFSGTIQLVQTEADRPPVQLQSGDIFGQECLMPSSTVHQFSALSSESSIILGINKMYLVELARDVPGLRENTTILAQSMGKILKKQPSWLNKDEFIAHIVRKNISVLFSSLVGPMLVTILLLLADMFLPSLLGISSHDVTPWFFLSLIIPVVWSIWLFFGWFNEYFVVTNQRVLLLRKVLLLYETRQETPMAAILSVTTETDLVGRWLTFGTVTVRTYTGSIKLPKIDAPVFFVSILQHFLALSRQEHENSKQEDIENYIRGRLKDEQAETASPGSRAPELQVATRPPSFIEALLGLREVTADSIIYRTHWFILIKRTFMPFILGVVLISFMVLRLSGFFFNLPAEIVLVTGCVFSLVIWIWWLYEFVDWRNDIYIITPDQVIDIDRKPLGSERRREAPLKNIQTIEYKRVGIWGLLFNFGTVFIHVGDTDLTFDFVSNPSEVQKELFERFMSSVLHEKRVNIESERQRMVEWMQAYQKVTGESSEKTSSNIS